jgi:hypothetical protein
VSARVHRRERPGIEISDVEVALIDRNVLPEQQLSVIGRPVERIPALLLGTGNEPRGTGRANVYDVDVVADTVTLGSVERDALAVVGPYGAAVKKFPFGELLDMGAGGVVIDLCVLVAALILEEDECAGLSADRGTWRPGRTDGVRIEGELFARAQWRGNPMNLLDVAESRRYQHRAIRQPVQESGLPGLPI